MPTLKVSEIFTSIQGEGLNIGTPSVFLRLATCNLQCIFCDTPYTWRFDERLPHRSDKVYSRSDEISELDVVAVYSSIRRETPTHVVITGGEPLLQQVHLLDLVNMLRDNPKDYSVEFETAGTIVPNVGLGLCSFVVSPKLANSGNALHLRRKEAAMRALVGMRSTFKFVVCQPSDFDEIDELVHKFEIPPHKVYIMGEGVDAESLSQHTVDVAQSVIDRGYKLTTRLQIYMWGNRRGV